MCSSDLAGEGALAMAAFTLGTVPMLVAIGIAGEWAGRRWRTLAGGALRWLLPINAAFLLVLAGRDLGGWP